MLADFFTANLEESSAVWKAKHSPSAVLLGRGEAEVSMFRWPQEKKFTVLEDFVLKVIESGLGNSDEEIARALCLEPADIALIVEDGFLKEEIESDDSRRSLPDNFTRRAPDGVALVDPKGKNPPSEIEGGDSALADVIKLADASGHPANWNGLSKERRKWMKEARASIFALSIDAFRYNDKKCLFFCGGQPVPPVLNEPLSKLEAFRGIGEKSAPPKAVCHRDEFWPWLARRICKNPPKSVVFESVRSDGRAVGEAEQMKWMEWIRKEASNIDAAIVRCEEKPKREAVCLDDERFELRGSFIIRAKTA